MNIQIVNYGACIRLTTDGTVLMLAKSQIKRVEVVRDDTVRINTGEGPLGEILIKLSDVTQPAGIIDVAALRDAITHMLDYSNKYELEAIDVFRNQLAELGSIKQLMDFYHGSWQTLWNYQQTSINTLMTIENILHGTKVIEQEIAANVLLQTLETKNLVAKAESTNELLEGVQDLSQQALNNQQNEMVLAQNQISELFTVRTTLEAIFGKVDSSNGHLSAMTTLFNQLNADSQTHSLIAGLIRDDLIILRDNVSVQNNSYAAMINLLEDIRTALTNP